nr:MAG TPA: hypothetical protein [Caudoviricetes sp.]
MKNKIQTLYCILWYYLLHPYFLMFLLGILFCRIIQIAW